MKVLLVLSKLQVHRAENLKIYEALAKALPDLTWCTGVSLDLYKTVPKGYMYLEVIDAAALDSPTATTSFSLDAFDVAIVDQSLDLTQDQSPSLFGGGIATRSLDCVGAERPSELVSDLTNLGVVCIGTSRGGVCLNELLEAGAVITTPLEHLVENLAVILPEAQRLVRENQNDTTLKALTLRQPFAWSIFATDKDVENRNWPTKVRGTIAIHAAYNQPDGVYVNSSAFIHRVRKSLGLKKISIPPLGKLDRGAIIGLVDIVDCVTSSPSAWFEGPFGFVLTNARLIKKPVPCDSKRRFFSLPEHVDAMVRDLDPQKNP